MSELDQLRATVAAAEVLADAVEDLLFAEGDFRGVVRDAWDRYVEAADERGAS